MKIYVDFSKEPTAEDVIAVANADWENAGPELIAKALLVITDALQEGKLALDRFGCNGTKKVMELLIRGEDPTAQVEMLSDLAYAFGKAHELSMEYGGIDLDTIPIWETEFGPFTVADVLRHGIGLIITTDEEKCRRVKRLLGELRAFAREVADLNAPYFPYIETDTINRKRLARAVSNAIELLKIAGGAEI